MIERRIRPETGRLALTIMKRGADSGAGAADKINCEVGHAVKPQIGYFADENFAFDLGRRSASPAMWF
jgi:hypothetical protein